MENITRGGTPLWRKKALFCIESSKTLVSLGNLTILSCEIRNVLSYIRIVQDSCVFMF